MVENSKQSDMIRKLRQEKKDSEEQLDVFEQKYRHLVKDKYQLED